MKLSDAPLFFPPDASHYLAFDLGAGSCRATLGALSDGRLSLREISRFTNRPMRVRSSIHWDVYALLAGMKDAMGTLADEGTAPDSASVDTWGVDFALLGGDGRFLVRPHCYRDPRTRGVVEEILAHIPRERLYELTGIQPERFNTLFQLCAFKRSQPGVLAKTASLLFMPDVFNFLLGTGKATELTIASTSQLYDPRGRCWVPELLEMVGLDPGAMQPVVQPGMMLGLVSGEAGMPLAGTPLVACASHDTASAVAAVPAAGDDWCFISVGTWSLMGIEVPEPLVDSRCLDAGFSNEAGVAGTFRFLKNLNGLWLLSRCIQAWDPAGGLTYSQVEREACDSESFGPLIDPRDEMFFDPADMAAAIRTFCEDTGQTPPDGAGGTARCVLESLALLYGETLELLRSVTGRRLCLIHLVGGGSRSPLLCSLVADACGVPVVAGPVEAASAGNVLIQAIAGDRVSGLAEARRISAASFDLVEYEPSGDPRWEEARHRFANLSRTR